jgi:hypothetical protein
MTYTTCNGWRNAHTWTVNLWFGDNFAAATEDGIEVTPDYCREAVEQYVEQFIGSVENDNPCAGFIWDMLDLNSVDWEELARHHAEMMEEPETDWIK